MRAVLKGSGDPVAPNGVSEGVESTHCTSSELGLGVIIFRVFHSGAKKN